MRSLTRFSTLAVLAAIGITGCASSPPPAPAPHHAVTRTGDSDRLPPLMAGGSEASQSGRTERTAVAPDNVPNALDSRLGILDFTPYDSVYRDGYFYYDPFPYGGHANENRNAVVKQRYVDHAVVERPQR